MPAVHCLAVWGVWLLLSKQGRCAELCGRAGALPSACSRRQPGARQHGKLRPKADFGAKVEDDEGFDGQPGLHSCSSSAY